MTIHIVEDDLAVRDSLAVLLENMGHQVACYADGETFLHAAQPVAQDAVIIESQAARHQWSRGHPVPATA